MEQGRLVVQLAMVRAGLLAYRSVLVQLTNAVAVMGRERNGALIAAALETCNINFEVSPFRHRDSSGLVQSLIPAKSIQFGAAIFIEHFIVRVRSTIRPSGRLARLD
jgi:hypothetical protein